MAKMMLCPACWGAVIGCKVCKGRARIEDVQLSKHFWLSEMTKSSTAVRNGFSNYPNATIISNLRNLCENLAEPVRDQFGPIQVNSGYRALAVNSGVSGSSSTSAHPNGYAIDFVPWKSTSLKKVVDWIISNKKLKYDQVIYEGTWVHLGIFLPKKLLQRRMSLMMFPKKKPGVLFNGKPVYESKYYAYDPTDARVF